MNKAELVAGAKRRVSRKPRDIDSFAPLDPVEVAMRLRRLARRLSSNKPRDPAKIADRKRDIRALMRGVVDCLAMDALKTRAALPLTFKPPKALDLTAPTTGALVIRPSARALAERDAQEGEIDASLTKKDLDLSRT